MEKTVRVCTIENQAESDIVCSILREKDVPYTLIRMEDSAYDGLYVSQGPWGFIEAPLPYVDGILQIVKDVRETRSDGSRSADSVVKRGRKRIHRTHNRPSRRLTTILVAVSTILAVCVVVLLIKNGDLSRSLKRYAVNQFIAWRWDASEKAMFGQSISTGRISNKNYDRNLNNIYEESVWYCPDGKRIVTYYDENEDGLNERFVVKSTEGTMLTEGEDLNKDGFSEREVDYYSQTDFVEYVDVDAAGLFGRAFVHKQERQWTIDLRKMLFADQP
jgi:hypothetical protein